MTRTVTSRALLARLKRKLAHEGETLHVSRGARTISNLGDLYTVNDRNCVVTYLLYWSDLPRFARELGCMHETEVMVAAEVSR